MPCVKIVLLRDGSITIEGEGFTGAACLDATERLEKALGTVTLRVTRPDLYLQEGTTTLEGGL